MKICKAFGHKWKFILGEFNHGWIKCERCGKNMFEGDIGVILINWKHTSPEIYYKMVFYEGNKKLNMGDALVYNERGNVEKC